MKILFLVKRHYTNKDLVRDRFGRLFHLPIQLTALGHACTVIAVDYTGNTRHSEQIDGVTFTSLPLGKLIFPGALARECGRQGYSQCDAVVSAGDSYLCYLASRLAPRLGAISALDIYDDYQRFGSNRVPGHKRLLTKAIERSQLLVLAGDELRDKYAGGQNHIVISNAVDPQLFHPMDRDECRKKLGIPLNEQVIGYFGTIHPRRGSETLVGAVSMLQAERPSTRLLLAGTFKDAAKHTQHFIDYRGMLDQDQLRPYINACDVVTIPYSNEPIIRMTSACKLMEYASCQVPMVVSDLPQYATYFSHARACVSRPGSAESLAAALRYQLQKQIRLDPGVVTSWKDSGALLALALEGTHCVSA